MIVNAYIDGYNFYRPIQIKATETRSAEVLHLAWCDYLALAQRLAGRLFGPCRIGAVKLFTAYAQQGVARKFMTKEGVGRKLDWLEALVTHTGGMVHPVFGQWQEGDEGGRPEEKQTDVKLAISLVRDSLLGASTPVPRAQFDRSHPYSSDDPRAPFDKALLISADKDLLPAAEMVLRDARKEVVICFPYFAKGYDIPPGSGLRTYAISRDDLLETPLPGEIVISGGRKVSWDAYVISKGWPLPKVKKAGM